MVLDTLDNLEKYVSLNPRFQTVVDFVRQGGLRNFTPHKEQLQGDELFANFALAKGKAKEEARLETHDKMIDIQIPISAPETMGYTPREALPASTYNAEKDITFYEGLAEQYVTVHQGEFAIFFPQDGHAPCVSTENEIEKVIFKVKVD